MDMWNIKIERPDGDLRTEIWTFWYWDSAHAFVLDKFDRCGRASRRHKFRVLDKYDRLEWRHWGSRDGARRLLLEEVPWPDDVIAEVRSRFAGDLRITQSMEALRARAA